MLVWMSSSRELVSLLTIKWWRKTSMIGITVGEPLPTVGEVGRDNLIEQDDGLGTVRAVLVNLPLALGFWIAIGAVVWLLWG
jgi:hypothetical protein